MLTAPVNPLILRSPDSLNVTKTLKSAHVKEEQSLSKFKIYNIKTKK